MVLPKKKSEKGLISTGKVVEVRKIKQGRRIGAESLNRESV